MTFNQFGVAMATTFDRQCFLKILSFIVLNDINLLTFTQLDCLSALWQMLMAFFRFGKKLEIEDGGSKVAVFGNYDENHTLRDVSRNGKRNVKGSIFGRTTFLVFYIVIFY